jgi:hypothetical protein
VKGRIVALDTKQRLTSGKSGLEAAVMDLVRDGTSVALPGRGQHSEGQ